jgi:hypothetical protein
VLESRSGPRAETLLRWNWNEGSVKEVDETALVQNLTGPKSENWNDDDD